jgi:hypothetical protein
MDQQVAWWIFLAGLLGVLTCLAALSMLPVIGRWADRWEAWETGSVPSQTSWPTSTSVNDEAA